MSVVSRLSWAWDGLSGGEASMEPGVEDGDDYPGRMLQQAALYNNTDFLESLLQGSEKDHVNAQDPYGRTALYTSVTNNSLECGHMLLQAGGTHHVLILIHDLSVSNPASSYTFISH